MLLSARKPFRRKIRATSLSRGAISSHWSTSMSVGSRIMKRDRRC